MTDFDLRHIPVREALEQLVERCLTSEDCLWRCVENLTPEMFAFDYDLRLAFWSTVGRYAKGTWDPATERDRLVEGMAALDYGLDQDPKATLADHRWHWERTIDDWYRPWTAVPAYVEALLAALLEMNQIEADTAAVLRDNFANAPLAVTQSTEDAVWDRIRTAALGRRALRLSTAVPALPRPTDAVVDWEGIVSRVYK